MEAFNILLPHALAWFLYFIAMALSIANFGYVSRIDSKLHIKHYLMWTSFLVFTVTSLFLGIQSYWIANSVIGDEPTTMMLLWSAFHYYNAFTYIVVSVGVRAYVKWRTTSNHGSYWKRNRKEDWL